MVTVTAVATGEDAVTGKDMATCKEDTADDSDIQGFAGGCHLPQNPRLAAQGFEPPPIFTGNNDILPLRAVKCAAVVASSGENSALGDSELQELIHAWHSLSPAIKTALLAIVRSATLSASHSPGSVTTPAAATPTHAATQATVSTTAKDTHSLEAERMGSQAPPLRRRKVATR